MIGDLAAAERHRQTLEQLADQDGLAIWQAAARCTRLAIQAAQGSAVPLQNFHAALTQLRATGYTAHQTWLAGIMAEAPGTQGTVAAKLALLNEALDTCERNGEAWIVAELLRIKAGLTALEQSAAALQAARATLHQALDLARAQGARSWELRATVSLVRLQLRANHKAEARALLTAVLDRFDEGFATADLMAANRLLDAMAA
jgi:hypothetical protein